MYESRILTPLGNISIGDIAYWFYLHNQMHNLMEQSMDNFDIGPNIETTFTKEAYTRLVDANNNTFGVFNMIVSICPVSWSLNITITENSRESKYEGRDTYREQKHYVPLFTSNNIFTMGRDIKFEDVLSCIRSNIDNVNYTSAPIAAINDFFKGNKLPYSFDPIPGHMCDGVFERIYPSVDMTTVRPYKEWLKTEEAKKFSKFIHIGGLKE